MKTYSLIMIAISLVMVLAVFVLKITALLVGKILLAVAAAFLVSSLIRLISLKKIKPADRQHFGNSYRNR